MTRVDMAELMAWAKREASKVKDVTYDQLLAGYFWEHPDDWQQWLREVSSIIWVKVLGARDGLEDDRRAAQVALAALRYLMAPPEEERVVVKRPAWKGEEARWIAEVEAQAAPKSE